MQEAISAVRFVIWDNVNKRVLLERSDAPVTFTRKGDALSALRREIRRRNVDFRAAERGVVRKEVVVPYREVTEDDFDIIMCYVNFSFERT